MHALEFQGYRAEVRRTFEATEKVFAADMKWRDDWLEGRRRERRNERRTAKKAPAEGGGEDEEPAGGGQEGSAQNSGGRIFPEEEEQSRSSPGRVAPTTEDISNGRALRAEGDTGSERRALAEEEGQPSSTGLSDAERHRNPEGDEGLTGAEEGLQIRPLGKNQATGNGPEALRAHSAGAATSPGSRRRSTRSPSKRRDWRRRTFNNVKTFAAGEGGGGAEEGAPGEDRTRGPCQGSGLLDISKQGLERQQRRQETSGGDLPPPSVSNVEATEEGVSSLVLAPEQDAEGGAEGDGTRRRVEAKGHPGPAG